MPIQVLGREQAAVKQQANEVNKFIADMFHKSNMLKFYNKELKSKEKLAVSEQERLKYKQQAEDAQLAATVMENASTMAEKDPEGAKQYVASILSYNPDLFMSEHMNKFIGNLGKQKSDETKQEYVNKYGQAGATGRLEGMGMATGGGAGTNGPRAGAVTGGPMAGIRREETPMTKENLQAITRRGESLKLSSNIGQEKAELVSREKLARLVSKQSKEPLPSYGQLEEDEVIRSGLNTGIYVRKDIAGQPIETPITDYNSAFKAIQLSGKNPVRFEKELSFWKDVTATATDDQTGRVVATLRSGKQVYVDTKQEYKG